MARSRTRTTERVTGRSSWKVEPAPRSVSIRTVPPSCCIMLWTTSSPTPRPESSVTSLVVEKEGRKRNSSSSASLMPETNSSLASFPLQDLLLEPVQIDAPSVVLDLDAQGAGLVAGGYGEGAGLGLAQTGPLLGRLQSVVQGVAQYVAQGGVQLLQHVAVHPGVLAPDHQPGLLADRAGDVPDHAGIGLDPLREGPHPGGDRFLVEALGELAAAADVVVEVLDLRPGSAR